MHKLLKTLVGAGLVISLSLGVQLVDHNANQSLIALEEHPDPVHFG
ncbi:hypothetical protein ACWE42_23380 [Sutcliffiella cohnii]|nr:hypothetical protein [Sutcliffiella cohnii]